MDLKKIRYYYIPWFYGTDSFNALADLSVHSLEGLNNKDSELGAIRDSVIYSAEKINLEAFCNDVFDLTLRRISIGQDIDYNDIFLGRDSESPSGVVFLGRDSESPTGDIFLGRNGEGLGDGKVIVNVPAALSAQNDLIKQGVDNYVRTPVLIEIVNF